MLTGSGFGRFVRISMYAVGRTLWYGGGLGAIAVFGWQLTRWLQDGHWTPMSLDSVFFSIAFYAPSGPMVDSFLRWTLRPSSWLGLHYLVTLTPTIVALVLVALVGMIICSQAILHRQSSSANFDSDPRSNKRFGQTYRPLELTSATRLAEAAHPSATTPGNPERNSNLTPVECDILRWLVFNTGDQTLSTLDVLKRHLKYLESELILGLSNLDDRGLINSIAKYHYPTDAGKAHSAANAGIPAGARS